MNNFKKVLNSNFVKLKKVSPGIMTALSIAGLIGTAALTVRATLLTEKALKNAEIEKKDKLTVVEKMQVSIKPCAPAIACGVGTCILMITSHQMSKTQIATLTAGYALLSKKYKTYTNKAKELFGEDGCKKIREVMIRDETKLKHPEHPKEDKMLYFEEYREEFFEVSEADVIRAEYEVNQQMARVGYVSLNFFYNALGLKPIDVGDKLGWNFDQLMSGVKEFENDVFCWIDFYHEKFDLEDGMEAINIVFLYPPISDYMMFE